MAFFFWFNIAWNGANLVKYAYVFFKAEPENHKFYYDVIFSFRGLCVNYMLVLIGLVLWIVVVSE